MPRRANSRKALAVHVPTELYEWIEAEAERRNVSRSKLVYAAVEFFRLAAGLGHVSGVMEAVRQEIPPPKRKRLTKMEVYLASKRLSS